MNTATESAVRGGRSLFPLPAGRGTTRVVVTSADRRDSRLVGALLAVEGHQVRFCHPPDRADVTCAGSIGQCPIATGGTDLVVDVRIGDGPPTSRDALCAAAQGIPVVLATPWPA